MKLSINDTQYDDTKPHYTQTNNNQNNIGLKLRHSAPVAFGIATQAYLRPCRVWVGRIFEFVKLILLLKTYFGEEE